MEAQQSAQVQRVRQKIAALTLAVSCFPFLAFSGLIFFDNHLLSTWSLSIIHYPRGLHAKSARAVTGRRCPHSGEGEDFLTRQRGFSLQKQLTREQNVKKWLPRREMNSLSEGYKQAIY